jgi:hypothetical protein
MGPFDDQTHAEQLCLTQWAAGQGESLAGIACSGWHCNRPSRGPNMHSIIGRFIQWVAEILDRSLYTVPDVDQ